MNIKLLYKDQMKKLRNKPEYGRLERLQEIVEQVFGLNHDSYQISYTSASDFEMVLSDDSSVSFALADNKNPQFLTIKVSDYTDEQRQQDLESESAERLKSFAPPLLESQQRQVEVQEDEEEMQPSDVFISDETIPLLEPNDHLFQHLYAKSYPEEGVESFIVTPSEVEPFPTSQQKSELSHDNEKQSKKFKKNKVCKQEKVKVPKIQKPKKSDDKIASKLDRLNKKLKEVHERTIVLEQSQRSSQNVSVNRTERSNSRVLSGAAKHTGILCFNCNACPIVGKRFKCLICTEYNLCANCEADQTHEHPMLLLPEPISGSIVEVCQDKFSRWYKKQDRSNKNDTDKQKSRLSKKEAKLNAKIEQCKQKISQPTESAPADESSEEKRTILSFMVNTPLTEPEIDQLLQETANLSLVDFCKIVQEKY